MAILARQRVCVYFGDGDLRATPRPVNVPRLAPGVQEPVLHRSAQVRDGQTVARVLHLTKEDALRWVLEGLLAHLVTGLSRLPRRVTVVVAACAVIVLIDVRHEPLAAERDAVVISETGHLVAEPSALCRRVLPATSRARGRRVGG